VHHHEILVRLSRAPALLVGALAWSSRFRLSDARMRGSRCHVVEGQAVPAMKGTCSKVASRSRTSY